MGSKRENAGKIDYKALRCELLRSCIEALLAVIQKPGLRAFVVWQGLAQDYHDLTTRNAPSVPLAFSLRQLRRQLETSPDRETTWLRLLDEVIAADRMLANSSFYQQFRKLSPFSQRQLFHLYRGLGPGTERRLQRSIAELKRRHGFTTDPTFRREINSSVFVSFDVNAGGSGQAST